MPNIREAAAGLTAIIAALFMAASQASCIQKPSKHPPLKTRWPETLRIGVIDTIEGLNPHIDRMPILFINMIYDPMIWWINKPGLEAQSRPINLDAMEISPDGKECRIAIKKGMLFHDGSEMTSKDVEYSIKNNIPQAYSVSFEIQDKYAVRMRSDQWIDWGMLLIRPVYSAEYDRQYAQKGGRYLPMGSGPYRFVSFDEKKRLIKLARWGKYWGGGAKHKYIEIYSFNNTDGLTMALLEGRIDYAFYVNSEDVDTIRINSNYQILETDGSFLGIITFNLASPRVSDWRVRKALSLLIPRQMIVDSPNGLRGKGRAVDTLFHRVPPATEPEYVDGYSPERAMELLRDAGYTLADGRLRKNGNPLKIKLIFASEEIIDALGTARMISKAWNDAGIDCRLQSVSVSEFTKRYSDPDNEATFSYQGSYVTFASLTEAITNYNASDGKAGGLGDKELKSAYDGYLAARTSNAPNEVTLKWKRLLQERYRLLSPKIPIYMPKWYVATANMKDEADDILLDPYVLTYLTRPSLNRK